MTKCAADGRELGDMGAQYHTGAHVHSHVMTVVGHEVLPGVCFGALVQATLLRTHDEQVFGRRVEVEAAAASEA